MQNDKPKLIRITTIPSSLKGLLKGQLKFMSQHFNVTGISSPGVALEEVRKNEGVRVIAIPIERKPNPIKDIISLFRLYKFFCKEKPNIVHTHTPKAGMVGMIASYFAGVPIRLHTVAGLPLMTRKGLTKKILVAVEWLTYKFANKVYPNAHGLKKHIEELGIVSNRKLKVIANGSSNGIDLSLFDPETISDTEIENIKRQYNIFPSDFLYICIGRIVKDKGINELAQAFKKLCPKYPQVKLLILGRFEDNLDPIKPEIKQYLQTSDRVILAGYQTDIRPFLKLANVFVHPSYREGFPNVVMQACAFNKPAVVTDINGSNEIIQNRVNGLVVPVADAELLEEAMTELYLDPEQLQRYAKNNRQIMEQKFARPFVWNEILSEYNYWLTKINQK